MILIDRHIAFRFLVNFITLFCLIFIFIVSVDVVLQFDSYVEAASRAVEQERFSSTSLATLMAILDFHGPRVFQSYSFLVGLVSVAAAGFTLSQMQRSRELVAMLAAGIPLQRVAVTIFLMACFLNLLQVVNQEFIIPRLASVLLREHGQILSRTSSEFSVVMTRDARDNLFSGRMLDANRGVIDDILVLTRDEDGTAERRISAPRRSGTPMDSGSSSPESRSIESVGTREPCRPSGSSSDSRRICRRIRCWFDAIRNVLRCSRPARSECCEMMPRRLPGALPGSCGLASVASA